MLEMSGPSPLEPPGDVPGRKIRAVETSAACLHIVGKNALLNRLLQFYLEAEMPFPCAIDAQPAWNHEKGGRREGTHMVLFDCYGLASSDLWMKLGFNGLIDPASVPVVLFNLCGEPDIGFEKMAIEKRVRGVFYHTEPLHLLPKGIVKILSGEIWFSRRATSCLLMEQQNIKSQTEAAEAMLTIREKEILIAIAAGAGNIDIAQELRISLHTVKSHIYNIYKKLEVRNRLEATLWVTRYL